jgi:hypothetical protein
MRARTVGSGLGVLLAVGCGSVPELRFGDEDAGIVSLIDSSLPADSSTSSGEAGPPPSLDDAGAHASGDASTTDGSSPSDAGRLDAGSELLQLHALPVELRLGRCLLHEPSGRVRELRDLDRDLPRAVS